MPSSSRRTSGSQPTRAKAFRTPDWTPQWTCSKKHVAPSTRQKAPVKQETSAEEETSANEVPMSSSKRKKRIPICLDDASSDDEPIISRKRARISRDAPARRTLPPRTLIPTTREASITTTNNSVSLDPPKPGIRQQRGRTDLEEREDGTRLVEELVWPGGRSANGPAVPAVRCTDGPVADAPVSRLGQRERAVRVVLAQ